VLQTCFALEKDDVRITYLPVDSEGMVNPNDVLKSITPQTVLISVMYANNETGVIQPIEKIGAIARERNIVFHTDAVQAVGKIPVNVSEINADLMSISGHKTYGPKGTGALYIRKGTPMIPVLTGGHHEYNLRAGTENIAGVVGLAEALTMAMESLEHESRRLETLRNRLEEGIKQRIEAVQINGRNAPRVPNTTSISFMSIEAESILLHLDLKGICASSGSACTTGSSNSSHVLLSMGIAQQVAQGTLRFSLGKENSAEDIDITIEALVEITEKLREISSL
jgi:cysteine desulfurase